MESSIYFQLCVLKKYSYVHNLLFYIKSTIRVNSKPLFVEGTPVPPLWEIAPHWGSAGGDSLFPSILKSKQERGFSPWLPSRAQAAMRPGFYQLDLPTWDFELLNEREVGFIHRNGDGDQHSGSVQQSSSCLAVSVKILLVHLLCSFSKKSHFFV